MILIKLLTFAFVVKEAASVTVNCKFGNNKFGYGCVSFDIFTHNDSATLVGGRHLRNYNNLHVINFWIPPKSKTSFVPSKACSQFTEMRKMLIQGPLIASIKRTVFEGCDKLDSILISQTKLDWLAEDTFADLLALEVLILNENKLKFLPSKLLDKTPKIHTFYANKNGLEVIELQFGNSVTTIQLKENNCVSQVAEDSTAVEDLNKVIGENCTSSKHKSLKTEITELHEKVEIFKKKIDSLKVELGVEVDNLKDTIEKLRKEKILIARELQIKIDQLQQENDNYQEQVTAFSSSVVHLKQQLEYHEKVKIEAQRSVDELEKEKLEMNRTLSNYHETLNVINDTAVLQRTMINDMMEKLFNLTITVDERDSQLQNLTVVNFELYQENAMLRESLMIPTTENPEEKILIEELTTNLTFCLEKVFELELVTVGNFNEAQSADVSTTGMTHSYDDTSAVSSRVTRFIENESFEDDASSNEILTALTSTENDTDGKTTNSDDEDEEDYDEEALLATVSTQSSETRQTIDEMCRNSIVVNNLQEQLTKLKENLSLNEIRLSDESRTDGKNLNYERREESNFEVNKVKIQELESKVIEMENLSMILALISIVGVVSIITLSLLLCRNRKKCSPDSNGIELTSNSKLHSSD